MQIVSRWSLKCQQGDLGEHQSQWMHIKLDECLAESFARLRPRLQFDANTNIMQFIFTCFPMTRVVGSCIQFLCQRKISISSKFLIDSIYWHLFSKETKNICVQFRMLYCICTRDRRCSSVDRSAFALNAIL